MVIEMLPLLIIYMYVNTLNLSICKGNSCNNPGLFICKFCKCTHYMHVCKFTYVCRNIISMNDIIKTVVKLEDKSNAAATDAAAARLVKPTFLTERTNLGEAATRASLAAAAGEAVRRASPADASEAVRRISSGETGRRTSSGEVRVEAAAAGTTQKTIISVGKENTKGRAAQSILNIYSGTADLTYMPRL